MAGEQGFHNRRSCISSKVRLLLISLTKQPSDYNKITPKIEYWIEYVLREQFTTVDELVEDISYMAWDLGGSYSSVARLLKEFHDAPRCSAQARSFVDKLSEHVLRWFAIASAEDHAADYWSSVASGTADSFVRAASLIGHLIECGLLSHELVRRHLVKPLISHYPDRNNTRECKAEVVRANAIYQLFNTAGNTLLRGLLEPEDVQVCFETLDTHTSSGGIEGLDAGKLRVRYGTRFDASRRNLTCLVRNFVRSMARGWRRGRKPEGIPQRLK